MDAFYKEGKGKDPILHFYETFLAEYDPKEREKRGVYYTPEPVVSFITRSVNQILKDKFDKEDGFADSSVRVLDPASGTCTFIAEAVKLAIDEYVSKYGEGGKVGLIKEHILKNFYAFELMMAPYAVGHLKLSLLFEEFGHKLNDDERFNLFLTNTLEMKELEESQLPGMSSLSKESKAAGKVKKEVPIMVLLGNPPYSGHSTNIGKWITDQIDNYKKVDGKPLGEKNPKWLQDDYVKFIRFCQWKIEQTGQGILAFITNHSWIDNPTFRGMRQSLMNTFDDIYVLDLHGNSLKKEKTPDGSKDENVFDIQQGVAISIFVKYKNNKNSDVILSEAKDLSKVFHSDIWGLREQKYQWLLSNSTKTTKWKKLLPKSEFYLFIKRDEKLLADYEKNPRVNEIFPINSTGLFTARDKLTIKWEPSEVYSTILNFSNLESELARKVYDLGKDTRDWQVKLAQQDIKNSGLDRNKIIKLSYRPVVDHFERKI